MALGHRRVHQARIEAALRPELHAVAIPDREPLGTGEELVVPADRELGGAVRQIREGLDPERLGSFACHRQCVGVLEAEGAEHVNAVAIS